MITRLCFYNMSCQLFCLMVTELQHCQVLSDEQKRALYDQYGEAGVKSTVGGASGPYTVTLHLFLAMLNHTHDWLA